MHTLLIVEDEKMIRQGIKAMVQRSGVPVEEILECSNGQMALEILRTQKVDVMFTDIRMPRMDGIELVNAMQELPNKPLTVAISGYDDFTYAVEMLRKGIRDYLLKPVDREQVKEILERLDVEIRQTHEAKENSRTIGGQQLRHLMWDDNVTETERSAILKQYDSEFYQNGYFVCCMENQGGELIVEEDYIYISNLGDMECYLMNAQRLDQALKSDWRRQYVGISSVKRGLEELREGFMEACKARKEAFWLERQVIYYDDTLEVKVEEPISIENYVQMLGTDKAENAIKQLRNIFWNARRSPGHCNLENEIKVFVDNLLETYEMVLQPEKESLEQLKHLYSYPCISGYEEQFMTWMENLAEKLNHKFEDYKNKQKIQQAVIYIRENYDKDLNMAVVSNYISMNYSLFSYAFKQYTGTNFVNFLKEIRMEKAKELLENTDLRIIEISQRIGYENEKHFMKIFKATCGVSPTEYRRNMQYKK